MTPADRTMTERVYVEAPAEPGTEPVDWTVDVQVDRWATAATRTEPGEGAYWRLLSCRSDACRVVFGPEDDVPAALEEAINVAVQRLQDNGADRPEEDEWTSRM